ncbi:MAG: nuclear transport factor 2 family protein [bacterium]
MTQTATQVRDHSGAPVLAAAPGAEGNLALVLRFLGAMENGGDADSLTEFFAENIISVEYPNRVTNTTARRDLDAMRVANERGRKALAKQHYELHSAIAVGNLVAVELTWTATLGVSLGDTPAGGEMTAHFAAFYECRHGKIVAIRNYDCFDPF